jgi:hypothetical protein
MARLNPLLGDEAQELLVERRRIGIQGLVGRVVEAEHLSVMWQATHFDPLPLDLCEKLQKFGGVIDEALDALDDDAPNRVLRFLMMNSRTQALSMP